MAGLGRFCQNFVKSLAIRSAASPASNLFSRYSAAPIPAFGIQFLPFAWGGIQVREMRHGMRRGRLGRDPKRR